MGFEVKDGAALAETVYVVLEVEAALFHLVVGEVVFALLVCMVSTAVLVLVVGDGRCDGGVGGDYRISVRRVSIEG